MNTEEIHKELVRAADSLGNRANSVLADQIVSGALVLKWAAEQSGKGGLSPADGWTRVVNAEKSRVGSVLNDELRRLASKNTDQLGGLLWATDIRAAFTSTRYWDLIKIIDGLSSSEGQMGSLGRAYDQFLDSLAEKQGKRGGGFRTPRPLNDLIVRLARLEEGTTVYDPFVGSGGILARSIENAWDSGWSGGISVAGQEINKESRTLAEINLLLHGVRNPEIAWGDTLTDPQNVDEGGIKTYDRVLTNPPFSMKYVKEDVTHPERMVYGWSSPSNADLMLVQHVLASLSDSGRGVVVVPHGVLFRGGTEAGIRKGMVQDHRIEAVIGIGPNISYGTGIPTALLVLRGKRAVLSSAGQVLFVNADQEFTRSRAQNRLEPHHIEKIYRAVKNRSEIPGFSQIATPEQIERAEYSLNISRYVERRDDGIQLLDVNATLYGGIPRAEVQLKSDLFTSFGIDVFSLFIEQNSRYMNFPDGDFSQSLDRLNTLSEKIIEDFDHSFSGVWENLDWKLREAAAQDSVLPERESLMELYCRGLEGHGPLDEYELCGVFADWWSACQETLEGLGSTDEAKRDDLLPKLGDSLHEWTARAVTARQRNLVDTFRKWNERYGEPLTQIQNHIWNAERRLEERFRTLGFLREP